MFGADNTMSNYQIFDWNTIKDAYKDCLLLGNGASIAVDTSFSYRSLLQEVEKRGLIEASVHRLFEHFATTDFEFVLKVLWQTYHVNQALGIADEQTRRVYTQIRDALIQAVRGVHAPFAKAEVHLPKISEFLKNFTTIVSLNYDLIVYWAMLYSNENDPKVRFKDCFIDGEFEFDWQRFRDPFPIGTHPTLVFYPHGNLVLATSLTDGTKKISRKTDGQHLVDQILEQWQTGQASPLFVSEGESEQKAKAIARNSYLNAVSTTVLPDARKTIAIYGWSMSNQDDHILNSLLRSGVTRIAVSVYTGNPDFEAYCHLVDKKIRERLQGKRAYQLVFFDSASADCWIN